MNYLDIVLPEIVDQSFQNRWLESLSNEEYHSDKTSVSSSGVRAALISPRDFYRGIVLGLRKKETKPMKLGSIVHMAVLEPNKFRSLYKMQPDFGDLRSPKNRDKRDAWISDQPKDAMIMTSSEYDSLMNMLESVMNYQNGMIVNMLKNAVFEKSGIFRDPDTGLKCRFRTDALQEDMSLLSELKTTRDPSYNFFMNEIGNKDYHVQVALYSKGVKEVHGTEPQQKSFIAVQNCEPYHVAVYEMPEGMLSVAEQKVKTGLLRIKKSLETDTWPGIQENGAEFAHLPSWHDNALEEM